LCALYAAVTFAEANRAARRQQQLRAYFGTDAAKAAGADGARPPLSAPGQKFELVTFNNPFRNKDPPRRRRQDISDERSGLEALSERRAQPAPAPVEITQGHCAPG
jgi:hypothetical protein